jgi:hypothetical protein
MKKVNMIGINLLVLILLTPAMGLLAQSTAITLPVFALSIEEKPLEAENTQGTHVLLVKYTNTSKTEQKDGCMVTPGAYKVVVLRDGTAVEKRKPKSVPEESNNVNSNRHKIKVNFTEQEACHGVDKGLKPGESVKFSLWVSSNYDLSLPGTYEITVTRETDRWNPEKSVTVKSNTLTIVVPEPGTTSPQ